MPRPWASWPLRFGPEIIQQIHARVVTIACEKILVLGATGGTGRQILSQALARGHDVSALMRSTEKLRDLKGAKLIVGDVQDENALRQALQGRDAVISSLGTPASPFKEVTLLSGPHARSSIQ